MQATWKFCSSSTLFSRQSYKYWWVSFRHWHAHSPLPSLNVPFTLIFIIHTHMTHAISVYFFTVLVYAGIVVVSNLVI